MVYRYFVGFMLACSAGEAAGSSQLLAQTSVQITVSKAFLQGFTGRLLAREIPVGLSPAETDKAKVWDAILCESHTSTRVRIVSLLLPVSANPAPKMTPILMEEDCATETPKLLLNLKTRTSVPTDARLGIIGLNATGDELSLSLDSIVAVGTGVVARIPPKVGSFARVDLAHVDVPLRRDGGKVEMALHGGFEKGSLTLSGYSGAPQGAFAQDELALMRDRAGIANTSIAVTYQFLEKLLAGPQQIFRFAVDPQTDVAIRSLSIAGQQSQLNIRGLLRATTSEAEFPFTLLFTGNDLVLASIVVARPDLKCGELTAASRALCRVKQVALGTLAQTLAATVTKRYKGTTLRPTDLRPITGLKGSNTVLQVRTRIERLQATPHGLIADVYAVPVSY